MRQPSDMNLKVLDLLEEFENKVEGLSAIPLTGKVMIDREEFLEIIREIHILLPEEYQHVKWLKGQKNQIIEDAQKQAEAIMQSAHSDERRIVEHAQLEERRILDNARDEETRIMEEVEDRIAKLVEEHELVNRARDRADEIGLEAERFAADIKNGAYEYAEETLSKVTTDIESVLETLRQNMRELSTYK